MSDMEKRIDVWKNILICLLLISAVYLMLRAMMIRPGDVLDRLGVILGTEPVGGSAEIAETELTSSAASPCFVLVTSENGSHYAAKYDGANKEKLVAQFSSYLGTALGSADAPVQIKESEWRQALGKSGVFFDYLYPQPLDAMASWLGTSLSGAASQHSARRLYLGSLNDVMCLYYIDADSASIYRCSTALRFSSLSEKIDELPEGGASFVFERGEEYAGIDPYFILSDETAQLRAMTVSNPQREGFQTAELLRLFGMNGRTTSEYTESDGSAVYVDGEKSLRIDISGELSFSVAEGTGVRIPHSGELSLEDCIAQVYSIVQQSAGVSAGEATLGLSGISNGGVSDGCTVYFSYFIDGVPVQLSRGYAVRAQISSGSIVKMDMVYRSYTYTGEMLIPLPEKQACIIASASGGEPLLSYLDESDSVSCQWLAN